MSSFAFLAELLAHLEWLSRKEELLNGATNSKKQTLYICYNSKTNGAAKQNYTRTYWVFTTVSTVYENETEKSISVKQGVSVVEKRVRFVVKNDVSVVKKCLYVIKNGESAVKNGMTVVKKGVPVVKACL